MDHSGSGATLRPARLADARPFLELFEALDAESEFMMFEPGERAITLARMRARLAAAGEEEGRERLIVAARRISGTGPAGTRAVPDRAETGRSAIASP